jgi:hypothetical protein
MKTFCARESPKTKRAVTKEPHLCPLKPKNEASGNKRTSFVPIKAQKRSER